MFGPEQLPIKAVTISRKHICSPYSDHLPVVIELKDIVVSKQIPVIPNPIHHKHHHHIDSSPTIKSVPGNGLTGISMVGLFIAFIIYSCFCAIFAYICGGTSVYFGMSLMKQRKKKNKSKYSKNDDDHDDDIL